MLAPMSPHNINYHILINIHICNYRWRLLVFKTVIHTTHILHYTSIKTTLMIICKLTVHTTKFKKSNGFCGFKASNLIILFSKAFKQAFNFIFQKIRILHPENKYFLEQLCENNQRNELKIIWYKVLLQCYGSIYTSDMFGIQ